MDVSQQLKNQRLPLSQMIGFILPEKGKSPSTKQSRARSARASERKDNHRLNNTHKPFESEFEWVGSRKSIRLNTASQRSSQQNLSGLELKQRQNKQQLISLKSLKDLKLDLVNRKTQPNSWVRMNSRFAKGVPKQAMDESYS